MGKHKRRLSNLAPNTRYIARVRSFNGFGVASDWSEAIHFETGKDITIPSTPRRIVTNFTSSNLIASWDSVDDNTDGSPFLDLAYYELTLIANGITKTYQTTNQFFMLTYDQNGHDFGTPQPHFDLELRVVDMSGNRSDPAYGTATNDPPPTPTVAPQLTLGFTMIAVLMDHSGVTDWQSYQLEHSADGSSWALLATVNYDQYTHDVDQGSTHYYRYKIRDVFAQASAGYSPVSSGTSLAAPTLDTTPPDVPTGLAGTAGIDNVTQQPFIDVTWNPNTEADLNRYELRLLKSGDTLPISIFQGPASTSYKYSDLEKDSTYTLNIRAYDHAGNVSAPSSTVTITTSHDQIPPAVPTGATTVSGIQTITVYWDPNIETDFSKYELFASKTSGFTPGSANLKFTGNASSYVLPAADNETWYFRLRAVDTSSNASTFTAQFTGTSAAAYQRDVTAPSTPTMGTLASAVDTDGSVHIDVQWTANTEPDLAGYKIFYRRYSTDVPPVPDDNWASIDVPKPAIAARIYGLVPNVEYGVKMLAYDNSLNLSGFCSEQTHVTARDNVAPSTPTNPVGVSSLKSISWLWDSVSAGDFDHYEAQVATSNTFGTLLYVYRDTTPAFNYLAPNYGTTYYMRVRAVDTSQNASGWSTVANATTATITPADIDTTAPSVPSGLTLATGDELNSLVENVFILASWTANSESDLAGYKLRIHKVGSNDYQYMDVPVQTSAKFSGLAPNTTYGVQIAAYDRTNNISAFSAEITRLSNSDATPPPVPTGITGTASIKSIQWSWGNVVAADLDHYEAQVSPDFTVGSPVVLYTFYGSTSSFSWAAPNFSTTYSVRVRALDVTGNASSWSSTASATTAADPGAVDTTPPTTPSGLSLSTAEEYNLLYENVSITATWTANTESDMAGYRLRIRKNDGTTADSTYVYQTAPFPSTSAKFPSLQPLTSYGVAIQAYDKTGNASSYSTEQLIVTYKDSTPPAQPANVSGTAGLRSIAWHWDNNTEPDFDHYEADVSTFAAFATIENHYNGGSNAFGFAGSPGVMYYLRVRAVDTSGNYSAWSTANVRANALIQDGTAPASSPAALVTSALGFMYVTWTPIINNDPVTYEVHISTNGAFSPVSNATTKVAETQATFCTLKNYYDGTPLAYGQSYYVRIIAKDPDGAAAPGTVGSGTSLQVDSSDLAPSSVGTTQIANGAVSDAKILMGVIQANKLNVSTHFIS